MKTEQSYFAFMQEMYSPEVRVRVSKEPTSTFRDGGSKGYDILNADECGYVRLVQDFSIGSKKRGTEGSWYCNKAAPNHIDQHPIDLSSIDFV